MGGPINARIETAHQRPTFRDAFTDRRCLVPATGFYEWRRDAGGPQPFLVRRRDGGLMGFAGLWGRWQRGAETLETAAILTMPSAGVVARIHDRMPVVVRPEGYRGWLDPGLHEPDAVKAVLRVLPAGELEAVPVSRLVNDPRNEGPAVVRELEAALEPAGQGRLWR